MKPGLKFGGREKTLSLKILGLDPGSHLTGVGIVQTSGSDISYLYHELIKAPRGASLPLRLHCIYDALLTLSQKFQPDVVVVENVFLGKNVDSAFKLGQARGAALLALTRTSSQILEISAREVKKILTGSGAAGKEQVRQMVCQWLKVDLKEKEMDVSDALSLAIAGCFEYEKKRRLQQLEGEL